MDDNDGPYYGGTSPLKIAFILGLVKAKDDPVLYLLVVNLLVSGIIGATIAWWFHKDKIKSQSLCFVLFVGICIVFQAVVSDVYLYHNPNTSSNGDLNPVNVNNASSIISPSTPAQLMAQMTNAIH